MFVGPEGGFAEDEVNLARHMRRPAGEPGATDPAG